MSGLFSLKWKMLKHNEEKEPARLGIRKHNQTHAGLKGKQQLCLDTKGEGNNGSASPEEVTSLRFVFAGCV